MMNHTSRSRLHLALALLLSVAGGTTNAQLDCMGVDGGPALPGTPCDDGWSSSVQDIWNVDCNCIGYCSDGMGLYGLPGSMCNDGSAITINDVFWPNCLCSGICVPFYGNPGDPCDDGDPLTNDDIVSENYCICSGWQNLISGQVFLDVDLDGVFGGPDMPIANRTVQSGVSWIWTTTDANGEFEFRVGPGFYTLLATSGSYDAPLQVNPLLDLSVPGSSSVGNALAMQPSASLTDLAVEVSTQPARPGFYSLITVVCTNEGTLPATGDLSVTFDALQTYEQSWPLGNAVGNTVTWSLPVLQLGETFSAVIRVRTPVGTALGTALACDAQVTPTPPDGEPANDQDGFVHQVVGSFDPNDIMVSPALLSTEDIASELPVTYTIRFQNTGTFPAENVRIADVLPFEVRPNSFDFMASSHTCHAQLTNGILEFRFDDIMLPDSNANEAGSHGWVMFRMRPQAFLTPGAQVYNSASIYFDFNEPIHTNAAVFAIEDLNTALPHRIREQQVQLWPNPARDVLNISIDRSLLEAYANIVDLHGRRVLGSDRPLVNATMEIPVGMLAEGLYTLRIEHAGGTLARRFVVSR